MLTSSTNDVQRYLQQLRDDTGCTSYLYSPTPFQMKPELHHQLNQAVHSLIDTIDDAAYVNHCINQKFWNLPVHPMQKTDFSGCADFLLTESGAKLIEINLNLPGKVGLMQLLGEAAVSCLNVSETAATNLHYLEQLVEVIRQAIPTDGKIALVVSHLINSVKHQPHYRFFAQQLQSMGLDAEVVQACEVSLHEEGCMANGIVYTAMINLVIPFVWERNPEDFAHWTKIWQQHPNRIFPNPTGGMLGTKDVLRYLDTQRHRTNAEDWTTFVLKARMLNEFHSLEALYAYLPSDKMVLKPLKDYDTKGVYVQPDKETINRLFFTRSNDYMVQEYTESLQLPFELPEGEKAQTHSVIYRVFFAAKQPIGYQAYYIHGEFNGDYYTAPVVVE